MITEPDVQSAISGLALAKAVIAGLATCLFLYYRFHWVRAGGHLSVRGSHEWKMAHHVFMLGVAAAGFMLGYAIEAFGSALGLSGAKTALAAGAFEAASLLVMLFGFYLLATEDVPHFKHAAEHGKKIGGAGAAGTGRRRPGKRKR